MYIPRLRRIPDVVKEMRESDPESVITYALIIGLIKQKKINITPTADLVQKGMNQEKLYLMKRNILIKIINAIFSIIIVV